VSVSADQVPSAGRHRRAGRTGPAAVRPALRLGERGAAERHQAGGQRQDTLIVGSPLPWAAQYAPVRQAATTAENAGRG
jgi:hypothetical protein